MKSLLEKSIYPFFETIRLQHGRLHLLEYHQRRMNHVFKYFYPGVTPPKLDQLLSSMECQDSELMKVKLSYNAQEFNIECNPYEIKQINRLVPIESLITYPFKYSNRKELDNLIQNISKNEEVLIMKDGRIRETTFGNVLLLKENRWYTPMYAMFYGVMRTFLMETKQIQELDLFIEDLKSFEKIKIVNAMMPPDACINIDISSMI